MITLLQYFPYCAAGGGAGGDMTTPWIPYPEQLGKCEVHCVGHLHNSGHCDIQIETSVNGVEAEGLGAGLTVAGVNTTVGNRDVTGSMVRVLLATNEPTIMTISIYLVPKVS